MSLELTPRPRRSRPDPRQLDLEQLWDPIGADGLRDAPASIDAESDQNYPLCGSANDDQKFCPGGAVNTPALSIQELLPSTLMEVLTRLTRHPRNPDYSDMASAVRGVGKVLGVDIGEIPSNPALLGELLAAANPARVGMSVQRWGRIKSLLRAALNDVGIAVMPGRDVSGLAPAWRGLATKLPKRHRYGLSRLLSYFSRESIGPEHIDESSFLAFQIALTGSLKDQSDALFRDIVKLWNEAAETVPGWPARTSVRTPDGRRAVLAADAFPDTFRADVEASLVQGKKPSPFDKPYFRPLRPATVASRRIQIYFAARTLVVTGFSISKITSVAVLVDVINAERILFHLWNEHGYRPSIGVLAQTLSSVAARWVKPSEADAERLREMAKHLTVNQKGMSQKNRDRLEQFDIPANVRALFNLPERVRRSIERKRNGTNTEAVRMAMALAVEILIVAPMRLANLTGLRPDKHIKVVRHGRRDIVHIRIPPEETKTGSAIDLTLTSETADLLEKFIKTYRPRIAGGAGPYLFPGRDGAKRSQIQFGRAISVFIHRETGLVMNPHLFRHLAAKLHLKKHPEDIETVRQFLSHTTTKVTLNSYAEIRSDGAFKRWGSTVTDIRGESAPPANRRSQPPLKGNSK